MYVSRPYFQWKTTLFTSIGSKHGYQSYSRYLSPKNSSDHQDGTTWKTYNTFFLRQLDWLWGFAVDGYFFSNGCFPGRFLASIRSPGSTPYHSAIESSARGSMTWKVFRVSVGNRSLCGYFLGVQKFPPLVIPVVSNFSQKKFDEVHNNDVETDNKIEMPKTVLFEAPRVSQILVEIARIFVIADV